MDEWRGALERLAKLAPPPSAGFHDQLWRRIRARERTSTRRYRRVATVAATAVIAASSTAGVFALTRGRDTVVDQTYVCSTHGLGGFQVDESVSAHSSSLDLFMATTWSLSDDKPGHTGTIYTAPSSCVRTSARVPLASTGLRHPNVLTSSTRLDDRFSCPVPSVLVRMHVTFSASGNPETAALAVRAKSTGKPLVYIAWKPPRMTSFIAKSCRPG